MFKRLQLARQVLHEGGVSAFANRIRYFARRRFRSAGITLPVAHRDLVAADWTEPRPASGRRLPKEHLEVEWLVPPIWPGSGGHHTLFRMVRQLEARGHLCRIYFHDGNGAQSFKEFRSITQQHFPPMKAPLVSDRSSMGNGDALFATSWPTAYPVYTANGRAKRFYFVQDYEPSFYPVGAEYVLAENTYRFGFHGVTMGRWLSSLLHERYGMVCDSLSFQVDLSDYHLEGKIPRNGILFYARPVTPRRGYELGVLALSQFARQHPEAEIHLVGWNLGKPRLPFKYTHHGILDHHGLNRLYNRCRAGLVISLTNVSLLPLELLAAGCVPVLNDAENTRLVLSNPCISFAPATPRGLARALSNAYDAADPAGQAQRAAASVASLSWSQTGDELDAILRRALAA